MSPRKKSSEPAIVAMAHAKVEENPRGAPEVVPVQWEDVPAVPTVQRLVESVVESAPACALDRAPIGAKVVVSRTDAGKVVRLLTPAGVEELDRADVLYTLPPGAKIRKVASDQFEVYRLGVQEAPLFVAATSAEAVRRFLEVVV